MQVLERELVKVKIADLKLDPDNPNEMSKEQMDGLRKSMERFGYLTPIVIDQDNNIADGEHRVLVYKEFGMTEILAFRVEFADDSERRLLRQVMNKLHGEHEKVRDANELLVLFQNRKLDDLALLIAQPKEDLQRILEKRHGIEFVHEDEFDVDAALKEPPITKPGDVWQLGRHRLMCGDATKAHDVSVLMGGTRIDMLVTDPPYGVNLEEKDEYLRTFRPNDRASSKITNDEIAKDYRLFIASFLRLIPWADYNTAFAFQLGMQMHHFRLALDDVGMKWGDYLIWVKNHFVLGRKDYYAQHEFVVYGWKGKHEFYGDHGGTILEYNKPTNSQLHPTMKPLPLLSKLIKDGSKPEAIVYDPFCGSGSTLIACEQTNRICFAMEIDSHYCDIIVKRWEAFTGQKAKLVLSQPSQ